MVIEDVVQLIMNNGVSVGCLVYFMVYNSKQLDALNKTIYELKEAINSMNRGGA